MTYGISIFPEDSESALEFDKIREWLDNACLSDLGRQALQANGFSTHTDELNFILRQVL